MDIDQILRNLGCNWITVTALTDDDHEATTIKLIKQNPKITKQELLQKQGIPNLD